MKIELHHITIWELVEGYIDSKKAGVFRPNRSFCFFLHNRLDCRS